MYPPFCLLELAFNRRNHFLYHLPAYGAALLAVYAARKISLIMVVIFFYILQMAYFLCAFHFKFSPRTIRSGFYVCQNITSFLLLLVILFAIHSKKSERNLNSK